MYLSRQTRTDTKVAKLSALFTRGHTFGDTPEYEGEQKTSDAVMAGFNRIHEGGRWRARNWVSDVTSGGRRRNIRKYSWTVGRLARFLRRLFSETLVGTAPPRRQPNMRACSNPSGKNVSANAGKNARPKEKYTRDRRCRAKRAAECKSAGIAIERQCCSPILAESSESS